MTLLETVEHSFYDRVCFNQEFTKLNETGSYNQCIVPTEFRKDLIYQVHVTELSGHLGSKRTKQKLLQKYYWYNMKEDANNYVLGCDICKSNKKTQKHQKPLQDR